MVELFMMPRPPSSTTSGHFSWRETVIDLASQAFDSLETCTLAFGKGEATFAVNRRNNPESEVAALRAANALKGPVDHSVPVLKVMQGDRLAALVFGYACHTTTLDSFEWSGDYPGFAQAALEERYPGTVAMFWAGCGADINPLPRRSKDLARDYGEQLAEAVSAAVEQSSWSPLDGPVGTHYSEMPLAFAEVPSTEELEVLAQDDNGYTARMAARLLDRPDLMELVHEGYPGLQQNLWVKFRICSGNAGRRVPLPLDPRTAETTCFMG